MRNEHGEDKDDGKGIVLWIEQSVRPEVDAWRVGKRAGDKNEVNSKRGKQE